MLFYDKNFVLVGMSGSVLKLLGYPSFHSFKSLHNDISELFLDENGNHLHKDIHFVKFMLSKQKNSIKTFISSVDNKTLEIELTLDTCYCNNEELYVVHVNTLKSIVQNRKSLSLENIQNARENSLLISNVFEQAYSNEMQSINKTSDEELGSEWLNYNAKKLSMSKDGFAEELKQLANEAIQKDEILFEALILGDKNQIKTILAKIRSKAYFLDIKPLIKILYRLENSENSEISVNFREYKDIITKINKLVERKTA
ncbi:MAG: hypothetical protein GX282_02490 [Campylobacteraceae bacterium]|nr:hypothetical protein [Campylobacteraceae bacterium]